MLVETTEDAHSCETGKRYVPKVVAGGQRASRPFALSTASTCPFR